MSDERFTFDTNVLVYAFDVSDTARRRRAEEVLDAARKSDCVLTLQTLAEFFAVATRKLLMPVVEAKACIQAWQNVFPTVLPKTNTLSIAISAVEQHGMSFWDAMLWAVAKQAGVSCIYTEDFQAGREIEGVRFENPFE
jgi:predicted nucleic acid-binding protein